MTTRPPTRRRPPLANPHGARGGPGSTRLNAALGAHLGANLAAALSAALPAFGLAAALAGCASSETVPAADFGRVADDLGQGGAGNEGGVGGGGAGGGGAGGGGAGGGGAGGGGAGGSPQCPDADLDGYQDGRCNPDPEAGGGDCNDANNLIHPGRAENCANRIDNDCNGLAPPDDPACGGSCPDLDGDGYQDAACNADRVTGGDCNDTDPNINPGVGEICGNGRDDDCIDGDIPCLANCIDMDLDGFGEGSGCRGPDCNDRDARINPWRTEICGDGIDQDCNGADRPCPENCVDNDRDGFGVGAGCYGPDCNDDDPDINPGAREIPGDGIDQDCNGADLVLAAGCLDRDQDGYGEGADCLGTDCDDTNPRVHAGRAEVCGNGLDDDCVGGDRPCVGIGVGECVDEDGDGFGLGGCLRGNFDCDDGNNRVNPDAPEICNGIDDNCNGQIDECPLPNQICEGDRCTGGPGAPCRNDAACAAGQGLRCDATSGQCRYQPGTLCEADSQCQPTAECVELAVCDDGERCYQAKGGPCAESCDCTDIWLCQPDTQRCVECLNDAQCGAGADPRDTCSDGGFCVQPIVIGGGGNDARTQLLRRIIACWSAFAESTEDHGCDVLLTENLFTVGGQNANGVGPASSLEDYTCDGTALTAAGFDRNDQAILADVFGCGLFELWNIWWPAAVTPNTAGRFCIYYAARKSGFGFPNDNRAAVVVDRCDFSRFD